jgi:hypothetical protein
MNKPKNIRLNHYVWSHIYRHIEKTLIMELSNHLDDKITFTLETPIYNKQGEGLSFELSSQLRADVTTINTIKRRKNGDKK